MTITEFLEARIAEDERHARKLADTDRRPALSLATTINHPQRLLAECATKRAIIHLADQVETMDYAITNEWGGGMEGTSDNILHALAAIYADHPEYQQEWTHGND